MASITNSRVSRRMLRDIRKSLKTTKSKPRLSRTSMQTGMRNFNRSSANFVNKKGLGRSKLHNFGLLTSSTRLIPIINIKTIVLIGC